MWGDVLLCVCVRVFVSMYASFHVFACMFVSMYASLHVHVDWLIDDHLYSTILRSLEQTHCARLWFYMSD